MHWILHGYRAARLHVLYWTHAAMFLPMLPCFCCFSCEPSLAHARSVRRPFFCFDLFVSNCIDPAHVSFRVPLLSFYLIIKTHFLFRYNTYHVPAAGRVQDCPFQVLRRCRQALFLRHIPTFVADVGCSLLLPPATSSCYGC